MMGYWRHQLFRGLQHHGALYGNPRLWRQVWRQSRRQGGLTAAAAIALLWLVSLLIISFLLLQLPDPKSAWLPAAVFSLARQLATSLGVTQANPPGEGLPGPWLVLLGWWAGLLGVAGTTRLTQTLALIYQGQGQRRRHWLDQLWPWAATALLLLQATLLASWLGPGTTLTGVNPASLWTQGVGLLRWLGALGLTSMTLGVINRCSAKPWIRGYPLWPGVGLTLGLGLVIWGLGDWILAWIWSHRLAYGLLLILGLVMIRLVLLLWLILLGAQFNMGLMIYGPQRRGHRAPPHLRQPPPPSFDSFKINR